MNSPSALVGENREDLEKQSAEKFQKFMYDLFEKNGVINDLRAYLRGHIVNVLKSTQSAKPRGKSQEQENIKIKVPINYYCEISYSYSRHTETFLTQISPWLLSGETLSCQKHFTQRLELTFQAINILIAEYLLRLEFSYSLSVFVSEIPLANMVFSFARMLMETHDHSELRFKDADVFSILNYIGLKCDSDHANNVIEMYNDDKKTPLLLCILKCLPMYKTKGRTHTEPPVLNEQDSSAEDSTTSKSSIEKGHFKPRYEKCKHYTHCKTCRARMARIKEKYKRKERGLSQSLRQSSVNSLNVESFMKNISVMEKGLIDELFQQLKSVYEAEIDMMKQEEDKRVKRSLITHAVQLQKKKEQLESSFKAREAALAQALQQKKRVLWSVARMLKQQHQQMARAMNGVTAEARDLALKEESLKTQLAEAETILRQRGEDMRQQISAELTILSNHLECMKLERDNINRERAQLENLKLESPNDQEHLRSNYDLIKDELSILKKYIETVKLDSKCVTERSTMTELSSLLDKDVVLNNRKEAEDEGPKRLVNDLKKQKNVNFEQTTSTGLSEPHRLVYEYRPRSRSRSRSSSEAGDAPEVDDGELILLQDENRRLKEFARQQKEHIDSLTWQHTRLQAQISSQSTFQPTILPQTSTYTPQTSNVAPQSANFTPLPTTYATISANFPALNAQSATFAPQVTNVTNFTTQSANFTPQSANFAPQTFHFAARSAFFAPQSSNMSRQSGSFAPQFGSFGTSVVHQGNVIQRPRTASPTGRRPIGTRLQPSTSVANLNVGWRVGAGEELSVFTSVPARVVLPGDDVPFIGRVGNRHTDNRRYLINQWRSLRRRLSPVAGVSKRSSSTSRDKPIRPCIAGPTILSSQNEALSNLQPSCSKNDTSRLERNYLQPKFTAEKCVKAEQKSSKEKLKDEGTKTPVPINSEKSPNSVLREAKLRLRKLEIEAEAVEKSYLDFRRKKEAREEREKRQERDNDIEDIKRSSSLKKLIETYTKEPQRAPLSTLDIDKLLNEVNTKLDIPSFKNKNSTEFKINPIPKVYSDSQDVAKVYSEKQDIVKVYSESLNVEKVYSEESKKENYLETPLNEFRRMYHSERRLERMERQRSPVSKSDSNRSPKRDIIREFKNKEKELEIFKHNLGKIYNMSENSIVNYPSDLSVNEVVEVDNDIILNENVSDIVENKNEPDNISYTIENKNKSNENIIHEVENLSQNKEIENINENSKELAIFTNNSKKVSDIKQIEGTTDNKDEVSDKNLLRVDVENISEVNSIQNDSRTQGFLLFVESAVDNTSSKSDIGTKISTQMTIVVGPKRSPRKINTGEETIERTPDISTDILEPLYNISNEQISSVQMQLEISKDALNTTLSELDMNEDADDFSADVDNYNSPSEFRNRSRISSPISLGKTSDDENFWES